jgi:hypothetical protein
MKKYIDTAGGVGKSATLKFFKKAHQYIKTHSQNQSKYKENFIFR